MVAKGIGGSNFPMSKVTKYRHIEYGTRPSKQDGWHWAFYPKEEEGSAQEGRVKGTQEAAVTACKAAIDAWLDQEKPN